MTLLTFGEFLILIIKKQLTWTYAEKPLVRLRLDYWVVSTEIQDDLVETNIILAINRHILGNYSNA